MVNPVVRGAGPEMMPAIDDFKVAPNRDGIRLTLTVTGKDEMDVPVLKTGTRTSSIEEKPGNSQRYYSRPLVART